MYHTSQRITDRAISHTSAQLAQIASQYTSAAVILERRDHFGPASGNVYNRAESNGDLVILICRDHRAVTVMCRRSDQKMTPESMRVSQLVDLTH